MALLLIRCIELDRRATHLISTQTLPLHISTTLQFHCPAFTLLLTESQVSHGITTMTRKVAPISHAIWIANNLYLNVEYRRHWFRFCLHNHDICNRLINYYIVHIHRMTQTRINKMFNVNSAKISIESYTAYIHTYTVSGWWTSLMPQAHQLNIKNQSPKRWTFSIGKTGWVENGGKQPLSIKEL